ncbi:MAG: zinc ABC transporter substrate-binding protein [Anaerolineaceae bacterium]|nr:zinc ABC transporter substrate-binding protein [Anaerolineaceae bacterium]
MLSFKRYALLACMALAACLPAPARPEADGGSLKIIAAESFLADIVQNVLGSRSQVDSLIPAGLDPHAFEPTPQDIVRITNSDVIVLNGGGLEGWTQGILNNIGKEQLVIVASEGLKSRTPDEGSDYQDEHGSDPHFWLDPTLAIRYVENIRDGLTRADPAGEKIYAENADAYIQQLEGLDSWIRGQVEQIPAGRRLLVTNHESFGYFADRYGFQVIGAVIPGVSTGSSPSARQMADLINKIRETGAPAIFLDMGANPQLAEQIGSETGARVITDLYTHAIPADISGATDYISMMKENVNKIVNALK